MLLVRGDRTGKVVLVTGTNAGLGFEAAKHFASMRPDRLIIACGNETKGKQAAERGSFTCPLSWKQELTFNTEIKEATNSDKVEHFLVDLASHVSISRILVENAAVAYAEFIPTPDGWEGLQSWSLAHPRVQVTGEPPCNGATFDPSPFIIPSSRIQGCYSSFGLCLKFRLLLVPTPQTANLQPRYP